MMQYFIINRPARDAFLLKLQSLCWYNYFCSDPEQNSTTSFNSFSDLDLTINIPWNVSLLEFHVLSLWINRLIWANLYSKHFASGQLKWIFWSSIIFSKHFSLSSHLITMLTASSPNDQNDCPNLKLFAQSIERRTQNAENDRVTERAENKKVNKPYCLSSYSLENRLSRRFTLFI